MVAEHGGINIVYTNMVHLSLERDSINVVCKKVAQLSLEHDGVNVVCKNVAQMSLEHAEVWHIEDHDGMDVCKSVAHWL